jgi:hypothetical protein
MMSSAWSHGTSRSATSTVPWMVGSMTTFRAADFRKRAEHGAQVRTLEIKADGESSETRFRPGHPERRAERPAVPQTGAGAWTAPAGRSACAAASCK